MSQNTFAGAASTLMDNIIRDAKDRLVELAELLADEEGVSQVEVRHVNSAWEQFLADEVDD